MALGLFSLNRDKTPERIKETRAEVEQEQKEIKARMAEEEKGIKVPQKQTTDEEQYLGAAKEFTKYTSKQNRERFSEKPHHQDNAGQKYVGPQNFIEGLGINPEEEFTPEALEAYNKLFYNFDHPKFEPEKPDPFRIAFSEKNKPAARVKLEEAIKKEFGVDSVDKLTVEQAEQLFSLDVDKLDIAKKLQIKDKGKELGLDSFGEDSYLKQVRDFYSQKKALDAYNVERDKNLAIVWKEAESICENHVRTLLGLGPNDPVQAQEPQPQPEPEQKPVAQTLEQTEQKPAEQIQPTPVQAVGGNEVTDITEPGVETPQTQTTGKPQAFNPAEGFHMSYEAEARVKENNKGASLLSIAEAFASAKTPEEAFQNALIAALLYLPNKIAWGMEYAEARAKEKNAYIEANLREHVKLEQEAAKERAAQEKERVAEEEKLRVAGLEAENRYDDAVATAKGLNATDRMRSVHSELFEAMGDMQVLAANIKEKNPKLLEGLNFTFHDDGKIEGDLDKLKDRVLAEGYFQTYGHKISQEKFKQLKEQSNALLKSGAYKEIGQEMADKRSATEWAENIAKEGKDAGELQTSFEKQKEIDAQEAAEWVENTAREGQNAAELQSTFEKQNEIEVQKTTEAQAQVVEPPVIENVVEPLEKATSEDKKNVVEVVEPAVGQKSTEQKENKTQKPESLKDVLKPLYGMAEKLRKEANSLAGELSVLSQKLTEVEQRRMRIDQARVVATNNNPAATIQRGMQLQPQNA